jgi:membrane protein DedA with SNARE-associated domain
VTLPGFLIAHGSALILPLSVIEGPIVAVAAGFLSGRGTVAWYVAVALLVAGDLIGDLIYYAIGRTGASPLGWFGARLGLRGKVTDELRRGLEQDPTRMLLIGKWTHSIGFVVLIGSGVVRVPVPRFLLVNLVAAVPKIAFLFGLGYFAGDNYPFFTRHVIPVTIVLSAAGVGAILLVLRRGAQPRQAGRP